MTNEFDLKARDWDKNLIHTERSEAIAASLQQWIPLHTSMKAMEFGAGTGLLSFLLKDKIASITLVDSSTEMIRIIGEKIQSQGLSNMKTLLIDLENESMEDSFDIIYSQMVFHHVHHIPLILSKLQAMLNPGGYLAIADLYPEDGSFHGEGFSGHKGFDVEELSSGLTAAGFKEIRYGHCFTIRRKTQSGNMLEFPVFLMIGRK